jgi:hypothetical protein
MRRKLRVHVRLEHGQAVVRVVRWRWSSVCDEARVAIVNLAADDADERLAEARMKARDMASQLNGLEGRERR